MDFQEAAEKLREFARKRDWEKFHSPKNLASALVVEAAELLEIFQWMKEEESRTPDERVLGEIREEIADIQIYLVRLCDVLGIDLSDAVKRKIEKNSEKYPVEKSRGNSKKYDEI